MTGSVFNALANDVANQMAVAIGANSTIISAIGYDAGSDVPTNSATLSIAGTAAPSGSEAYAPLEVSSLWRFTTTQRTTKNHPIYLFKYIRNQILGTTSDREAMVSGRNATQTLLAASLVTGFVVGGTTYKLAGPFGAVAQSGVCESFFTHRDFPK